MPRAFACIAAFRNANPVDFAVLAPSTRPDRDRAREPSGWLELAVVALCFASAGSSIAGCTGARARRPRRSRGRRGRRQSPHLPAGHAACCCWSRGSPFRHFQRARSSSSLAMPLLIALALIRLLVYALRGVFGAPAWLKTVGARDRASRSGALVILLLPRRAAGDRATSSTDRAFRSARPRCRCSTIARRRRRSSWSR